MMLSKPQVNLDENFGRFKIGQMSQGSFRNRDFGSLPSSTETNPRDHVKSILTTDNNDMTLIRRIGSNRYAVSDPQNNRIVKHPKGIAKNVPVGIGKFVFPIDFIILYMPEDVNVPLILRRPFLSIAHAKIDVFKRKITLRVKKLKNL
ncbi:putative reverse transcriptase domain-containing protein [Tanacetum coccineum]